MTWTNVTTSQAQPTGNWNRFIQACDVVVAGQRGVDFHECISTVNPWSITSASPISIKASSRENPA